MLVINTALLTVAALLVYIKGALDLKGVAAAFIVGFITLELGGLIPFLALLVFLMTGTLATRFKYHEKARLRIAEGKRGVRSWGNVLGNGLMATFLIVLEYLTRRDVVWAAAFASIATANADTLASELGKVYGKRPRLITNLRKRVEPGSNGGVTLHGELFALLGAMMIALISFPLFENRAVGFLAVLLGGLIGCNADSIIGATVENRGWFNNDMTNFAATVVGALVGALVFEALTGAF